MDDEKYYPVSFTCKEEEYKIFFGKEFGREKAVLVFPITLYEDFLKKGYDNSDYGIINNWLEKGHLEILVGEEQ